MARCPLNAPGRHRLAGAPRRHRLAAWPALPDVTAQQTAKRRPRAAIPGESPALGPGAGRRPAHTAPARHTTYPHPPVVHPPSPAGPGAARRPGGTGTGRRLRPRTPAPASPPSSTHLAARDGREPEFGILNSAFAPYASKSRRRFQAAVLCVRTGNITLPAERGGRLRL